MEETAGSRRTLLAIGFVPVAMAVLAYHGLRQVFFDADDFLHLYVAANGDTWAQLWAPYGGHLLATWRLAVAGFYALAGPDAQIAGLLVLGTHVANTALLWDVVRRLTDAPRLAAVLASCWAGCAVHYGSLGWYSVYGQVLATLLLLLTLRSMLIQRERPGPVAWPRLAAWWIAQALAATSFGLGLATAIAFPLAAELLLPSGALDLRRRLLLLTLPVVVLLLWSGIVTPVIDGTRTENDTPVGVILFPVTIRVGPAFLANLLGAGTSYLVLAPGLRRAVYPGAIGVGIAVAGALLVLWSLLRDRARRRPLVALLLLATVSYGSIALGRAALYEAFRLRAAPRAAPYGPIEPRYHYLGTTLLAAILGVAAAPFAVGISATTAAGLFGAFIGATAFGLVLAPVPLDAHPRARRDTERVLDAIRAEVAKAPPGATVRLKNWAFPAVGLLMVKNLAAYPGAAATFLIWHPDGMLDGRRVVFEIDDPAVLAALRARPDAPVGRVVVPPQTPVAAQTPASDAAGRRSR